MCILSYDVVTEKTPVTYGTCHLRDKMKKPISGVINLYNTVKSIEYHWLEYKEIFLQSFLPISRRKLCWEVVCYHQIWGILVIWWIREVNILAINLTVHTWVQCDCRSAKAQVVNRRLKESVLSWVVEVSNKYYIKLLSTIL